MYGAQGDKESLVQQKIYTVVSTTRARVYTGYAE